MINWMRLWVAMSSLTFPMALASRRRFRQLPELTPEVPADPLPSLSIIIPARNEAENLGQLLPTLEAIEYPGDWEVIVVDDDSSDKTAEVARNHGAAVVEIDDLPAGWLGKTNACQRGSEAAAGEWLLFIDADTRHHRLGAATAVAYAQAYKLDGLSLFPRQLYAGLVDRLALLPAFAGLFTTLDHQTALLNGQFILIHRAAYQAIGGFSQVAGDNLEDVALAHRLREVGLQVPVLRGDQLVAVQMYQDKRAMWHGLARLGSGHLRFSGLRSLVPIVFITSAVSPALAVVKAFLGGKDRRWAIASWLWVAAAFWPWSAELGAASTKTEKSLSVSGNRRSSFLTITIALFSVMGALFFQLAAVWGIVSRMAGFRLVWRGRRV